MIIFWIIFGLFALAGFTAFTGAPYVPSKRREVEQALSELVKLTDTDVLVDLGSGDGLVLRTASRRGARAVGYELHPVLVYLSRFLSRRDTRVEVRLANFWRRHLPDDTTVIYVFGDGRDVRKFRNYITTEVRRLGREVSVVSYGFEIFDNPVKSVGAHHLYKVA